jgi:hypothetical protein
VKQSHPCFHLIGDVRTIDDKGIIRFQRMDVTSCLVLVLIAVSSCSAEEHSANTFPNRAIYRKYGQRHFPGTGGKQLPLHPVSKRNGLGSVGVNSGGRDASNTTQARFAYSSHSVLRGPLNEPSLRLSGLGPNEQVAKGVKVARKPTARDKVRLSSAGERDSSAFNTSLATARSQMNGSAVEKEEEKVKNATLNLVKWLRNRLVIRLGEVSDLQATMVVTQGMLNKIAEKKQNAFSEREAEIRKKIESQKRLYDFRRKVEEPTEVYNSVTNKTRELESQLQELGKSYDELAKTYVRLQTNIREAGFSHWLDARGRTYLPETAVGVISKSAEILSPVIHGIGRAVELDQELAEEVEELVPIPHSVVFTGVLSDILILVPIIPILAVAVRVAYSVRELTILHHIVLLGAMFSAQGVGCFLLSLYLTEDALRYFQRTNEPVLICILFVCASVYALFMFLLAVVCIAENKAESLLQLASSGGAGYYFYRMAFRPAVLDGLVAIPIVYYLFSSVLFLAIASERNRGIRIRLPLQSKVDGTLLLAKEWLRDTAQAMAQLVFGRSGTSLPSSNRRRRDGRDPSPRPTRNHDANSITEAANIKGGDGRYRTRPQTGVNEQRTPALPARRPPLFGTGSPPRSAEGGIHVAGRFVPPFRPGVVGNPANFRI